MSSTGSVGILPFGILTEEGGTRSAKRYRVKPWVAFGAILLCVYFTDVRPRRITGGRKEMTVSAGTKVSIEYTLRLEDKAVIDTNVGSDPLTYVHGSQQIIPGLEKALEE